MKQYKVKIKGKTPYMQHRMDDQTLEDWEKNRGKIIERKEVAQEDYKRALFHSYNNGDGQFYMPSEHLRGSFINGGKMVKSKVGNSRRSMANIVAGMFFIKEDKLPLPDNWEIDKRSAVNKNIKARVISIRPKWVDWNVEFTLEVDNDTITDETTKAVIENAGKYIGIGSFRPEHNGMFGRFEIEKFELIQ